MMMLGKRILSLEGLNLLPSPGLCTAVVSLSQHAVSVSPRGFDTTVVKSLEKKPFLVPPSRTRSSSTKGSWKFKPLPSEGKTDIFSKITVFCRNHC